MKTVLSKPRHARQEGWALMIVMMLGMGAILVAASVLSWSNATANETARNNEYYATTYAAESATEKVLTAFVTDYENYGAGLVASKLSTYSNYYPTASDNAYFTNYIFSAGPGQSNTVGLNLVNATNVVVLGPPYSGLYMLAATYEVIATAVNKTSGLNVAAAVGQGINLGTIPIFQFAIFFQNVMEVDPGANLTVNGFVHGNNYIYIDTTATLVFSNDVSASGNIILGENPLDPSARGTPKSPSFDGYHLSGVNPLILPVGTNQSGSATNTSQNVSAILQIPPAGITPTSPTGSNYLYNQADMIILVSNGSVMVTSGVNVNNQATIISNNAWSIWLNTNLNTQFYDQREGYTMQTTDIDVGMLRMWSATNQTLRPLLGRDVDSIFIADERSNSNSVITTNISFVTNYVATNTTPSVSYPAPYTYAPPVTTNYALVTNSVAPTNGTYINTVTHSTSPTRYAYDLIVGYSYQKVSSVATNISYSTNQNVISEAAIVLTNGATLPPNGLSIVTPDPAYIVGNYNVSTNTNGAPANLGTFNTTQTYPAAVFSDAVTILSSRWNPLMSSNGLSSRQATNDTVNAAILTGQVQSDGNYYSGGVENFPRFLEDWSTGNYTFTYNGSLVSMFSSIVATGPWPGTGIVYNPPTRNWAFDLNFNNAAKQPPLTPHVITVNRGSWTFVSPYATSY